MIDHLDDEAVSAAIDGEATDAERAHLASCATCAARADTFRAAAAAIAVPPPVDPTTRDGAIAHALAPQRRRVPRWALGAAAAVLLLVVAVPLVARTRSNSRASSDAASTAQARDAAPGPAANAGGAAASPMASVAQLGDVDAGTFAARVRSAVATATPNTVVTSSCAEAVRRRDGAAGSLRYAAGATVAGRPVDVLVFLEGSAMRAFAVAPDTCQDVLSPVAVG